MSVEEAVVENLVRRVVTSSALAGPSTVLADDFMPAQGMPPLAGHSFHVIWQGRVGSELPASVPDVSSARLPPGAGEYVFGVFRIDPRRSAEPDGWVPSSGSAEPAYYRDADPQRPGMHAGFSVSYLVVITGEAMIELDSGERVHLRAGDTMVQLASRKEWWNPADEPCLIAAALIGTDLAD